LTVELKDDTKETSEEAIGLATFSNGESTVWLMFQYLKICGCRSYKNEYNHNEYRDQIFISKNDLVSLFGLSDKAANEDRIILGRNGSNSTISDSVH
jgi:hypothetical protein